MHKCGNGPKRRLKTNANTLLGPLGVGFEGICSRDLTLQHSRVEHQRALVYSGLQRLQFAWLTWYGRKVRTQLYYNGSWVFRCIQTHEESMVVGIPGFQDHETGTDQRNETGHKRNEQWDAGMQKQERVQWCFHVVRATLEPFDQNRGHV